MVAAYDAFVIGSAAYMFKWLGEATGLVDATAILAEEPIWLFSSGPLGTEPSTRRAATRWRRPSRRRWPSSARSIPATTKVFFGARNPNASHRDGRAVHVPDAGREVGVPKGDFRDWPAIEAWAAEIARELQPVAAG